MSQIQIKRIYEEVSLEDGYRILVDRLWPRGVSKERAKLDEWNKTISPTPELRKWFSHETERFKEFSRLYREELNTKLEDLNRLKMLSKKQKITLLFGTKDLKINHAIVLQQVLNNLKL
ncbi:MAG: DUF488 domain-containing protein [Moheibacter sp.]